MLDGQVTRSELIEPRWMIGIDPEWDGLKRARRRDGDFPSWIAGRSGVLDEFVELGRHKVVGGQVGMMVDVALQLSKLIINEEIN